MDKIKMKEIRKDVRRAEIKYSQKKTISNAIAHLNGYSKIMTIKLGYKPIAVLETIEELKLLNKNQKRRIKRGLKKAGVIL